MEVRPKIEWDVTEWERPSTSGQAAQQQQEMPPPLPQQKEGDEEAEEEGVDDLHDDIEDNEQLNEALRSYATNYNLTTQKVKNIIFVSPSPSPLHGTDKAHIPFHSSTL